MTLVEHANAILGALADRRRPDGRIPPFKNTELLRFMGRDPSNFAVAYGQTASLLDIGSLESGLPFFGRLIEFDRGEDDSSWEVWKPFESLLYYSAPRLKSWSDIDILKLRDKLPAGAPHLVWEKLQTRSEELLTIALEAAQIAIRAHAEQLENSAR